MLIAIVLSALLLVSLYVNVNVMLHAASIQFSLDTLTVERTSASTPMLDAWRAILKGSFSFIYFAAVGGAIRGMIRGLKADFATLRNPKPATAPTPVAESVKATPAVPTMTLDVDVARPVPTHRVAGSKKRKHRR